MKENRALVSKLAKLCKGYFKGLRFFSFRRSMGGLNTLKAYWGAGAQPPSWLTKEQREKFLAFDAKLTPEDIVEMQTIDSDCNDCRHFKRGAMVKVPGLNFFEGECLKTGKATRAYPVQYSGRACFEHRKSPK